MENVCPYSIFCATEENVEESEDYIFFQKAIVGMSGLSMHNLDKCCFTEVYKWLIISNILGKA